MSDPRPVVVGVSPEGTWLTHTVSIGPHELIADEPVDAGGADLGPTPYDLLLGALGSCTAMTIQMYARRKELLLEDVQVTLTHSRIYAKDCEDCETKVGLLDHIERRITLVGELSDEQRAKLLEIADKCPVHRTLKSEIAIHTKEG